MSDVTATTTASHTTTTETVPPTTAASAQSQSAAPPVQAAASPDWITGLSDELKGYAQTKGFKDPAAVLDSYRGLEKTIGVPPERILKMPENMDTPEGRAIYERLGAPKEAKDYKIEIPPAIGDQKLADGLRDVAFKNNFTHRQVESLVGWWNEQTTSAHNVAVEEHKAKQTQENDGLKKEWGAAYEQNKEIANQAARRLGLDNDTLLGLAEILGPAKAFKALHDLGVKTGEAQFVIGKGAGGEAFSPAAAKERLRELRADESFIKRFSSGDADAVKTWNKLNEQAWAVQ